jgi:hypothetical protein
MLVTNGCDDRTAAESAAHLESSNQRKRAERPMTSFRINAYACFESISDQLFREPFSRAVAPHRACDRLDGSYRRVRATVTIFSSFSGQLQITTTTNVWQAQPTLRSPTTPYEAIERKLNPRQRSSVGAIDPPRADVKRRPAAGGCEKLQDAV